MGERKFMKVKKITKLISVYLLVLSACAGCSISEQDLDKIQGAISPYVEEEKSDAIYEVLGEKLIIDSDISSLKIVRGSSENIEVSMVKKLGGSDEEALKEEIKKVNLSYEAGKLNISSKISDAIATSNTIRTTIKIPNKIEYIEIYDDLGEVELDGDYKNLNVKLNIGEFSYTGEAKNCDVNVNTGDINLDLKKVEKDYVYNATAEVGDIKIKLPYESKINLNKECSGDEFISKGMTIDKDGAAFNVKTDIGDIEIGSN